MAEQGRAAIDDVWRNAEDHAVDGAVVATPAYNAAGKLATVTYGMAPACRPSDGTRRGGRPPSPG